MVPSLLAVLTNEHLDPGYAEAANRRRASRDGGSPGGAGSGDRRARGVAITAVVAALIAAGVLFGVAGTTAKSNAPRDATARSGLLDDIGRAQQRVAELAVSATGLAAELRSSEAELGAAGPLQTVAALEDASQITPVTGPGLRIVIDEAPAGSDQSRGGVILDRDVQLLVNDLWAAGAEAIAIGGVRVQPRSAIRQAGGSILVDNRPVFFPITVDVVGDQSGLQVRSAGSPGFGRFSSFAQLYGVTFDLSVQDQLALPGGSGTELLYARPAPATPSTAGASTAGASTSGAPNAGVPTSGVPTPTS